MATCTAARIKASTLIADTEIVLVPREGRGLSVNQGYWYEWTIYGLVLAVLGLPYKHRKEKARWRSTQ
jgi:hypothetical protein